MRGAAQGGSPEGLWAEARMAPGSWPCPYLREESILGRGYGMYQGSEAEMKSVCSRNSRKVTVVGAEQGQPVRVRERMEGDRRGSWGDSGRV